MSETRKCEDCGVELDPGIRCGCPDYDEPEAQPTPPAEGETAREPIVCIACGAKDAGGCEVEDGPGPFCLDCWDRIEAAFSNRAEGETAEGLSAERLRCASCGAADFYVCGCYDKCLCGHDRRNHLANGTCTHVECACCSGLHGPIRWPPGDRPGAPPMTNQRAETQRLIAEVRERLGHCSEWSHRIRNHTDANHLVRLCDALDAQAAEIATLREELAEAKRLQEW